MRALVRVFSLRETFNGFHAERNVAKVPTLDRYTGAIRAGAMVEIRFKLDRRSLITARPAANEVAPSSIVNDGVRVANSARTTAQYRDTFSTRLGCAPAEDVARSTVPINPINAEAMNALAARVATVCEKFRVIPTTLHRHIQPKT